MPDTVNIYDPKFIQSLKKLDPLEGQPSGGTEINMRGVDELEVDAKAELYSRSTGLKPEQLKPHVVELDNAKKQMAYEDRKRSIDSQFKVADMQADIGLLAYDLMQGVGNQQAILHQINALEKDIAREAKWIQQDGIFQKAVNSAAAILPSMMKTTVGGIKVGGYAAIAAGSTAALLGQAGPQVLAPEEVVTVPLAAATAFMAGTRIQGARLTQQMEAGLAYYELMRLKDEQGMQLDPKLAYTTAQSIGAINGLIEAFGLGVVMRNLPGTKQMYERIIRETVTDAVTKGTIKTILLRAGKSYGKTVGAETLQEISQEITQILGEEIVKKVSNEFDGTNMPEAELDKVKDRLWEVIETTALGVATLGIGGAGGNIVFDSVAGDSRSKLADNPAAADLLPEDKHFDPGKELENAYRSYKNVFLGSRDIRLHRNRMQAEKFKSMLKAVKADNSVDNVNAAIQLYLDAKPGTSIANMAQGVIDAHTEGRKRTKLTDAQIQLWEASRNLTDEQKAIASKLEAQYKQIADLSFEAGIIRNVLDTYASRQWNLGLPDAKQIHSTFYKATRHARQRIYPSIVHGWAKGGELRVKGATENLALYKDTIIKTLEQRKFFNALSKLKHKYVDPETGKRKQQSLFSTVKRKGYTRINVENWKIYSPVATAMPGNKILETEDGTTLHETSVYVPDAVASDIENLFGISKLKQVKGKAGKILETVTKYNAILKAITLSLSAFHAFAYMRSYYLGGPIAWSDPKSRNFIRAYRDGVNMMKNMDPIVELGIKNGLTVALQQDWQREYMTQSNAMSKIFDKWSVSRKMKDHLVNLNEMWLGFLFSSFGSGLKIKTFALEFKKQMDKNPMADVNEVAERVANLVNDDFGGLHLERMGRDPTLQHVFQLLFLAPDWTESNLRTVLGMFKKAGNNAQAVRQLYRHFWARIITKGLVATALMNVALAIAFGDGEEKWDLVDAMFKDMRKSYLKALKQLGKGNIRKGWQELQYGSTTASELARMAFSIDISPIYHAFGGDKSKDKYMSLFGHFMDPVKFARHPNRVLRHKQSIVAGMAWEFINGEDWAGRRFTSLPELLEGEGLSTYKSAFKDGVPIVDTWYVSFILAQLIGHSPVGTQNLISSISGETDYFDSLLAAMGLQVSTAHK